MLRLASEQGVSAQLITLVKTRCVELVEHIIKDKRSLRGLSAAKKFSLGQISRDALELEAQQAFYASHAAAREDSEFDGQVAFATYAADYASDPSYDVDEVVYAVADALAYGSDNAQSRRLEVFSQCADICREVIPFELLNLEGF